MIVPVPEFSYLFCVFSTQKLYIQLLGIDRIHFQGTQLSQNRLPPSEKEYSLNRKNMFHPVSKLFSLAQGHILSFFLV